MNWIRDRITDKRIKKVKQLTAIARQLDITTAQLAIAWLLRRKEISSVITGATRLEQLDENLLAAEAQKVLTEEILIQIETILGPLEKEPDE
jgi:aryl-alcohol dehydrogenase-like predicted oxidoreductase